MKITFIKLFGCLLIVVFGVGSLNAQYRIKLEGKEVKVEFQQELILEKGVKRHKGIDAIYKSFSESYRTLKPEIVANLYKEDAAYLSPNNDITNGRKAILDNFTNFFKSVKSRGQNMTISFQIFQRRVTKKMGYDVGVYTINFYKDGKKVNDSKGKFVVVAVLSLIHI